MAAARALADETGSAAFTVAQLTSRPGLSLKAFYACFRSKDDLLLALLAEDSRIGADVLAERIGARTGADALQRLRVRALRHAHAARSASATRACSCASTGG